MHSRIKVVGETFSLRISDDVDTETRRSVGLIGATFPVAPSGTTIELLSVRIPEGLHALALYSENDNEDDEKTQIDLLLCWKEGSKWFVVSDEKMSASDLSRFNSFVRSDADVLVIDPESNVVYCSDLVSHKSFDLGWVHRLVSMNTILGYITKKLTLAEVAEQAVSERQARDKQDEEKDKLKEEIENWKRSWAKVEDLRSKEVEDRLNVTAELEESRWLYDLLKRLPALLRPKALRGYFNAMDFLFNDEEYGPRGC